MDPRAKVLVSTPLYTGDACGQFTWSMMSSQMLCLGHKILLDFDWISSLSMIDVARDFLVERFWQRADCTHLMFIDSDLGWQPDAIHRMLLREADVIGGVYPRKSDDPNCSYPYNADSPHLIRGLRMVTRLPGGFLLLSRKAVAALREGAPVYKVPHEGKEWDVPRIFDMVIENGHMVSEDYRVCDKLRALGFQLWAEVDINFTHTGRKTWPGNLLRHELAQAKKNAAHREEQPEK